MFPFFSPYTIEYCKTGIFRKGVFFGIFEQIPKITIFRKTFKPLISRNSGRNNYPVVAAWHVFIDVMIVLFCKHTSCGNLGASTENLNFLLLEMVRTLDLQIPKIRLFENQISQILKIESFRKIPILQYSVFNPDLPTGNLDLFCEIMRLWETSLRCISLARRGADIFKIVTKNRANLDFFQALNTQKNRNSSNNHLPTDYLEIMRNFFGEFMSLCTNPKSHDMRYHELSIKSWAFRRSVNPNELLLQPFTMSGDSLEWELGESSVSVLLIPLTKHPDIWFGCLSFQIMCENIYNTKKQTTIWYFTL